MEIQKVLMDHGIPKVVVVTSFPSKKRNCKRSGSLAVCQSAQRQRFESLDFVLPMDDDLRTQLSCD